MCFRLRREILDIPLGVDGRHATRAGRGDGLAVDVILDVAAREHAGYVGRRAAPRHDVAVRVEIHVAADQAGVGDVPDGDEDAVDGELLDGAGLDVAQHHAGNHAARHVLDLVDHRIELERDLLVGPRLVLHDLRRPECIAPVNDGDVRGELRQERRLLHRRVAAAHHRNRLAPEEVPVAGGACRHAVPHQGPFGFQPEQPRRGARGQNQRARPMFARVGRDGERPLAQSEGRDVALDDLGAEPLRLGTHFGDQGRPQDAVAKPRVVLDVRGQHQLAARLEALDEQRLQIGASRIEGGSEPRGPGADDDDVPHPVSPPGAAPGRPAAGPGSTPSRPDAAPRGSVPSWSPRRARRRRAHRSPEA